MKIVAWNLKNIGTTKLKNKFNPYISEAGLGNNVLDYIMKVVMGQDIWKDINTPIPADIFVVIELKTGGQRKGLPSNGASIPTLASLTEAMNQYANAGLTPPNTNPNYQYNFVLPKVIGYHECVGVIYNTQRLTVDKKGVLRNTLNKYLKTRTPFWVRFTETAEPYSPLNVVGLHAPPPKGNQKYKEPVDFAESLNSVQIVNQVNPTIAERICVLGDFNCSPGVFYTNLKRKRNSEEDKPINIFPFTSLVDTYGYTTTLPPLPAQPVPPAVLPNNILSSLKRKPTNTIPPIQPTDYLNDAYDNVLYKLDGAEVEEKVLNLIGNAPSSLYPQRIRALVSNYWTVSDHLPVTLEF